MTGPRVLLIEHERATPAGLVGEWLDRHDANLHVVAIDEGVAHDPLEAYDLVVSLGSESSAYDDHLPWLGHELELMRAAAEDDVPVLGICFGAQLLARALGAKVFPAGEAEIGWLGLQSRSPQLIATGPWFQWHFDTFSLPPEAKVLAYNHVGPQAFVHRRSLGVQFHPEVSVEIMETWAVVYRHELEEHGVDAEELLEQTRQVAAAARDMSLNLLEGFYDHVALLNTANSQ